MQTQNNLEINGNLTTHPLVELLVEIRQARLDGSLRLSFHTNKTVIYVKSGEVVFAVSNQRQHRVFEMLLQAGAITKKQLVEIPDFASDQALMKALGEKEILSPPEIDLIQTRQIEVILKSAFEWKEGSWIFSPLARIKEEACRKIDICSLLIEAGRNLPKDTIVRRYRSFREAFGRKPVAPSHINLRPQEAFVVSRFEKSFLQIEEIKALSGLSESETLQTLYILWLGGFLFRQNLHVAFSESRLSAIQSARLELKRQAFVPPEASAVKPAPPPKPKPAESQPENIEEAATIPSEPKKAELTLEKYLAQVENAETHYEILNISHKSTAPEIKQAYFNLAKCFHPDLFHKQTDAATHQRIQHAFTEIAHAYETLRDEETRRGYDFKLRKLLAELEKLGPVEEKPQASQKTLREASEIFEHGFNLLMEEEYESALPYLVRAVHLSPDIARYHAYYGKVLSIDKAQRYKAEAELQSAIKLEPENPTFRIMLAEFFIQYNLFKRAEGELNRLLANTPNNPEALALLDSLRNK